MRSPFVLILLSPLSAIAASRQPFRYKGKLTNGGVPANGSYDLG